jgi:hypothetical protein
MHAPKRSPRGPDRHPTRLKAGEARCAECHEPMPEAMAVGFNKLLYHPIGCFPKAFDRFMGVVRERIGALRTARLS